uniref:NADH-ubiquinone oxidoreductase chain 5 n=1 Tax=Lingula anatina TaxID=7574 RepID=A0A0R7JKZ6_LINAN|nr:NADH dehydrogenase subunit 5 [Lingula anatina]
MNLLFSLLILFFIFLAMSFHYLSTDSKDVASFQVSDLGPTGLDLDLVFDKMSSLFACLVCFISFSVVMFSFDYMKSEKNSSRFYGLLGFFILSMLILIFVPHLPGLFLGWDMLGMSSFLLVSYYKSGAASKGAMLTALTSRVGDVFLLVFCSFCLLTYGTVEPSLVSSMGVPLIGAVLLALGAMTKSAQIPFSSWLPAAMAAPTPVSALVHSSTLVTAGVYILIRNYSILGSWSWLLIGVGGATMFLPGLMALWEVDLKRIVALSTLSQLGLLFFYLGVGLKDLAFVHMMSHAIVKAMLFVCVGTVIDSSSHCQDISFLGGRLQSLPLVQLAFYFSLAGLMGLPYMGCYFSKHMLLSQLASGSHYGGGVLLVLYLGLAVTVAYSVRLLKVLVVGNPAYSTHQTVHIKSTKWWSSFSILLLLSGMLAIPYITYPLIDMPALPEADSSYNLLPAWMLFGVILGLVVPRFTTKGPDLFMDCFLDQAKESVGEQSKNVLERCDSGWWEMYGIMGAHKVVLDELWKLEILTYEKFKAKFLKKDPEFYEMLVGWIDYFISEILPLVKLFFLWVIICIVICGILYCCLWYIVVPSFSFMPRR